MKKPVKCRGTCAEAITEKINVLYAVVAQIQEQLHNLEWRAKDIQTTLLLIRRYERRSHRKGPGARSGAVQA